jgi:hypothetical protein
MRASLRCLLPPSESYHSRLGYLAILFRDPFQASAMVLVLMHRR